MMARALILAAGFAIGGCASLDDYGHVGRQNVTDAQGNVAGFKQMLRNERTGEVAALVRLFKPIRNQSGELVGYEETTHDGAIIRDLDGRQVGGRFSDLRSRATNARSRGVTIIIGALNARPVVAVPTYPLPGQLVASLTAAELRAIR